MILELVLLGIGAVLARRASSPPDTQPADSAPRQAIERPWRETFAAAVRQIRSPADGITWPRAPRPLIGVTVYTCDRCGRSVQACRAGTFSGETPCRAIAAGLTFVQRRLEVERSAYAAVTVDAHPCARGACACGCCAERHDYTSHGRPDPGCHCAAHPPEERCDCSNCVGENATPIRD